MKKILTAILSASVLLFSCSAEPEQTEPYSSHTAGAHTDEPGTGGHSSTLRVIFGDVGKGDFILLSCDGEHMVIDSGYKKNGDYVEQLLRDAGVQTLKYAVATHPDKDHIGSMTRILKNFDVQTLYVSPRASDSGEYEKMLKAAEDGATRLVRARVGDVLTLGAAVLTTLSPCEALAATDSDNEMSVVQLLQYGERRILFMADAQFAAEGELLLSGADLSADVIKIAHHGSAKSSTKAFLSAVGAEYGVISAASVKDEQLPDVNIIKLLGDLNMEIYRTDRDGAITLECDGINIKFEREKG